MTIRDISYRGEGMIPAPLDGPALRYEPLPPDDVTDIAVHHMTGTGPPASASVGDEINFLVNIDAYHRGGRGLDGIGYHIVPMASGRIYITSRLDRYGAHVGYENNHLLGLALPGDYTSQLPAPGHLAAAAEAVKFLYGYLGREVPTTPHLNWGGTTCPGVGWREWVPQLQAAAQEENDMAFSAVQEAEIRRMARNEVIDAFEFAAGVHGGDPPFTSSPHTLREWMDILVKHLNDGGVHGGGAGLKRGDKVTLS